MTETPPNPTPETPPTPPATPPATPPEGYVPQSTVNSMEANWRRDAEAREQKAREEALTEAFKDLGLTDPKEIRAKVEAQINKEKADQSKAEQLEGTLTKEQQNSQKYKSERDAARSAAQKLSLNSEARLQALALGVDPNYVDGFLDAANKDLGSIQVGDEKNGYSVDGEAVKAALSGTLERLPIFKGGSTPPPPTEPPSDVGFPPGPGDPPSQQNEYETMPDDKFWAIAERVKRGEKVTP